MPDDPALRQLDAAEVRVVGVRRGGDVISELGPRSFLHSGPPLVLHEIPGPMRGALIGALMFEREAADAAEAEAIIDAGEIALAPCHHVGAVGAMAGLITPSMPVLVAESSDRRVFSPLNEGLGKALRFGSYDDGTLRRLRWMCDTLRPLLDVAIATLGGVDLVELISEGLRRGDECHNRNVATSALLIARLAPVLVRLTKDRNAVAEILSYAAGNRHFALPFSMTLGKGIGDSAQGFEGSPIVTAMCGNGRRFGIRVSGGGDRWFLAPAPVGEPVLFDGFTKDDATPTMGDSMITETVGYGAFALTAAPAITSFVGGSAAESRDLVERMRLICAGTSTRFLIPGDDFRGTPLGIDVHRVAESGISPVINNGMAHRKPGGGQVGAGITRVPLEPFLEASAQLRQAAPFSRD